MWTQAFNIPDGWSVFDQQEVAHGCVYTEHATLLKPAPYSNL